MRALDSARASLTVVAAKAGIQLLHAIANYEELDSGLRRNDDAERVN
jgi:hypothetical protein